MYAPGIKRSCQETAVLKTALIIFSRSDCNMDNLLLSHTSDYKCHGGYHSITSVTIASIESFTIILPVVPFNNFTMQ